MESKRSPVKAKSTDLDVKHQLLDWTESLLSVKLDKKQSVFDTFGNGVLLLRIMERVEPAVSFGLDESLSHSSSLPMIEVRQNLIKFKEAFAEYVSADVLPSTFEEDVIKRVGGKKFLEMLDRLKTIAEGRGVSEGTPLPAIRPKETSFSMSVDEESQRIKTELENASIPDLPSLEGIKRPVLKQRMSMAPPSRRPQTNLKETPKDKEIKNTLNTLKVAQEGLEEMYSKVRRAEEALRTISEELEVRSETFEVEPENQEIPKETLQPTENLELSIPELTDVVGRSGLRTKPGCTRSQFPAKKKSETPQDTFETLKGHFSVVSRIVTLGFDATPDTEDSSFESGNRRYLFVSQKEQGEEGPAGYISDVSGRDYVLLSLLRLENIISGTEGKSREWKDRKSKTVVRILMRLIRGMKQEPSQTDEEKINEFLAFVSEERILPEIMIP